MNFSAIEESISEEKKKLRNFLSYFFKNSRVLIILLVLSVITAISISIWRKSPDYQVLYSSLSNEDSESIISQLNEMKIPYQISQESKQLLIPKDKVYTVRLYLAENHLPRSTVGFELLDKEKFGISQFGEQINYQRALEGELSRTIERIDAIKDARIHLALPKDSLFLQDKKKPSASVIVTLKPGKKLDIKQVNAILHLISSSISDLGIENITIVNQFGTLLNHSVVESDEINDLKLRYIQEIEANYKNKIKNILEPLFGTGNIHAQVSAQIDFNNKEKTQETYSPNSNYKNQSVRSQQRVVHDHFYQELKKTTANYHNFQNKNKQEKSVDIKNNNNKKDPIFKNSTINHDDTINYELNHTISHIKSTMGEIKRLSAAVVVNYIKDQNGKFIPLNLNQIQNIKNLVQESIGYSKVRGDTVHVINENFSQNNQYFPIKFNNSNQLNLVKNSASSLIPWLISVIFIVLFFLKKYFLPSLKKSIGSSTESIKKDTAENTLSQDIKNEKRENVNSDCTTKKLNTDKLIHQICNISNQNPRIIASIIRQWMSDKK